MCSSGFKKYKNLLKFNEEIPYKCCQIKYPFISSVNRGTRERKKNGKILSKEHKLNIINTGSRKKY